jgi:hypothetical protein
VRALAACVLVLFGAALAGGVESGQACSCALPDPRAALAQADGAFVGTLVSRRQLEQQAVLEFTVDSTLKGSIGRTVEVRTAANGAACGLEAPVGTRVGLVLERRGGTWHGYLCWQFDPDELLAAAKPLPAPSGRGPVALVVGGEFGDVRLIALDARGRTLAYGKGGGRVGLMSVCPGRARLTEIAYTGTATTLVVRTTRTLRIVARRQLHLPGRRYAQRLRCQERSGAAVVVFARGPTNTPAGSALYRVELGRVAEIWRGSAYDAAITATSGYLSAGIKGKALLRVDLRGRPVRQIAGLPDATTSLALNRTGTLLAGIQIRTDRSARVVRIDLGGTRAKVSTARFPANEGLAQVFWLPSGRLLFVPAYGTTTRLLDASLRTRSRFRWTAATAALAGSQMYGTDISVALFRAELPSGPMRVVRRLPGRPTLIVAAAP